MGAAAILELLVTRDVLVAGPEGPAYDSLGLLRPVHGRDGLPLVSSVPPTRSFAAPIVRKRD
jgi:hypothetical protein